MLSNIVGQSQALIRDQKFLSMFASEIETVSNSKKKNAVCWSPTFSPQKVLVITRAEQISTQAKNEKRRQSFNQYKISVGAFS